MKLLVSGATGFIGRHLIERLIKERHHVVAIVRPTTNADWLKSVKIKINIFDGNMDNLITFMSKEKFDGVIHLASLFLAKHKSSDVIELINSNVGFSATLLEASVSSQTAWFINTGTFWQHYQNKQYSPVNLYSATKQAFESIAQYYIETANINFVTIKLCDTFGPGDTRPKVMNLWSKISSTGEALDMSPGEQIIDISFVDNVVDGYDRMIEILSRDKKKSLNGHSFAISSPERMTLKQLSAVFERVTKKKLNLNWGKMAYRPREVMTPWERGQTIPGWKSKISIAEGIKRTFNVTS